MQYVSVLVIFVWVLQTVKSYVFQNQLVTSIKYMPWKKDYWLFNKTDFVIRYNIYDEAFIKN